MAERGDYLSCAIVSGDVMAVWPVEEEADLRMGYVGSDGAERLFFMPADIPAMIDLLLEAKDKLELPDEDEASFGEALASVQPFHPLMSWDAATDRPPYHFLDTGDSVVQIRPLHPFFRRPDATLEKMDALIAAGEHLAAALEKLAEDEAATSAMADGWDREEASSEDVERYLEEEVRKSEAEDLEKAQKRALHHLQERIERDLAREREKLAAREAALAKRAAELEQSAMENAERWDLLEQLLDISQRQADTLHGSDAWHGLQDARMRLLGTIGPARVYDAWKTQPPGEGNASSSTLLRGE